MMSGRWSKKNWPALAGRVVPPLVEAAALVWTRHKQRKASRHMEHQASEMESLAETLKEKDAQIARLSSQLASCQEEMAQAQQTIARLQEDLEQERRKTWWEKLLRRR